MPQSKIIMIKKYLIKIDIPEDKLKKINEDFSEIWYAFNQIISECYNDEYKMRMKNCTEVKE